MLSNLETAPWIKNQFALRTFKNIKREEMWETEAEEIGLDMSMAMSKASWLIGMDPAKGRQGSARLPCKKNRTC
jgi:hypothetical protein